MNTLGFALRKKYFLYQKCYFQWPDSEQSFTEFYRVSHRVLHIPTMIKYNLNKWFLIALLKERIDFVTDLCVVLKNQTYSNNISITTCLCTLEYCLQMSFSRLLYVFYNLTYWSYQTSIIRTTENKQSTLSKNILKANTDQKKLRIWTLFTLW